MNTDVEYRLKQIKNVAYACANNQLDRLSIEEELLLRVARNPDSSPSMKCAAMRRWNQVNEDQRRLVNGTVSKLHGDVAKAS